jgi:hypothetical protein
VALALGGQVWPVKLFSNGTIDPSACLRYDLHHCFLAASSHDASAFKSAPLQLITPEASMHRLKATFGAGDSLLRASKRIRISIEI